MIHADKRGARVKLPSGRRWRRNDSFAVIVFDFVQHDNSVWNRTNYRQATIPTQRNDSEVITYKQKQWMVQDSQILICKVDMVTIAVKNTHLETWINYISSAPGAKAHEAGLLSEPCREEKQAMIRKYELVACLPTPLARHPQLQPWKAPACTDRVMPRVLLHTDALLHRRLHRTTESKYQRVFLFLFSASDQKKNQTNKCDDDLKASVTAVE